MTKLSHKEIATALANLIQENLGYSESSKDSGSKTSYKRIADQMDDALGYFEDMESDKMEDVSLETFVQNLLELIDQGQNPDDHGM